MSDPVTTVVIENNSVVIEVDNNSVVIDVEAQSPWEVAVSASGPQGPQGIPGPVESVNSRVGEVILGPADVGLSDPSTFISIGGATFAGDISVGNPAGVPGTLYAALGIDPTLGPFLNLGAVGNNANLFAVDGELHSDSHIFSDSGVWAEPHTEHDWSGVYAGFDSAGLFYSTSEGLGQTVFSAIQIGESNDRFRLLGDGSLHWGDGTNAPDTVLRRAGVKKLRTDGVLQSVNTDHYISHDPNYGISIGNMADSEDRLALLLDGSLHWSSGTNALDRTLARNADGLWSSADFVVSPTDPEPGGYTQPLASLSGDGTLNLFGNATINFADAAGVVDVSLARNPDHGLILTDPNDNSLTITPDGTTSGSFVQFGYDYATFQIAGGSRALFFQEPGEAYSRLAVSGNGNLEWGGGVAAPDVILQRTNPGVLVLGDKTYTGPVVQFATAGGEGNIYIQNDGTDAYIDINPGNQATIVVGKHGGGINLSSPDGLTNKTLTIDNTGTLTLL